MSDDAMIVVWENGQQVVRPALPGEIPAYSPSADEIRAQRNALLAECDWTQLPDAPVDQTAWAVYRQVLRDITDQEGFPTNVVWPNKPE